MNKKDYKIKNIAIKDIETIADYIANDNKKIAQELIKTFEKTFEKLAKYPNLGVTRKDFTHKDVKFFVVKKNYLIVYNIEKDTVCILRVLAAYQDICKKL